MRETDRIAAVERWFIKRGIPHFIADYSATEDVLTRALPVLTAIFLLSAYAAVDLAWPLWGIVLAVVGGFAVLVVGWSVLNRMRGRPPFAPPSRVGAPEIAAFVLIPAVLPILFSGDFGEFLLVAVSQIIILGIVYLGTSYGLVAVAWWAIGQTIRSLGGTFRLFARGLPLLLLGFMFLFINTEAWQTAGTLEPTPLGTVVALFAVLSAVFVIAQMPREIGQLVVFERWSDVAELCAGSPMAGEVPPAPDPPQLEPLTKAEWGNVGLVVLVNQGLQILLVSGLVGAFFVVFGLLLMQPDVISLWIGSDATLVWRSFSWFGRDIQLTTELLTVSTFLAAFAGLYFSVYTITDKTFRAEFFDDVVGEVREALAVRAVYRALRPSVNGEVAAAEAARPPP